MKENLACQTTKVNGENAEITDKKNYNLAISKNSKKRKFGMEILNSIMIRGQKSFETYDQLNPVEIKIEDDCIINILKSKKNETYRFVPISLLFSSGIKNDTEQIFIVTNGLNKAKDSLINGKIYKILAVINLAQTNNWENTKGVSNWIKKHSFRFQS